MNEQTQNDGLQTQFRFIEAVELRDYFAAQALAAHSWRIREPLFSDIASDCYKFADAMLKARAAK